MIKRVNNVFVQIRFIASPVLVIDLVIIKTILFNRLTIYSEDILYLCAPVVKKNNRSVIHLILMVKELNCRDEYLKHLNQKPIIIPSKTNLNRLEI